MSAPIHSLLADELEISEQNAEKLLSAMLREVRKRARREGVRLPDLGKFSERDGALTFEPSEALARAVNHRFEGLETEDLQGASGAQETETQESDGPSTITLGYQDSDWSPLDSADADAESDSAESPEPPDEQGADTEEFQAPETGEESPSAAETEPADTPPSASEQDSSPPTHELDAPASSPPDRESTSQSEAPEPSDPAPDESAADDASEDPDRSTEAEELYPLVEDVSGEESASDSEADDADDEAARDAERDELSKIWKSDAEEDETDFEPEGADEEPDETHETEDAEELSFSAADDPEDATLSDIRTEPTEAEETELDETPDPESTDPSPAAAGSDAASDSASTASSEPSAQESSSTLPRVLVTLLVFVLLGGGAWYILGQRGLVPSPGQTLGLRGPQTAASSSTAAPSQTSSPQSGEATSSQGTSGQDATSSSDTTADASSTDASADAPQSITPSAGGWTIVVASRRNRDGAASLLGTYRQRFSDRPLPVDIVQGTVDNATRYRVGIGQFRSRIEAQTFLDTNSAALPDGAWLLQLE